MSSFSGPYAVLDDNGINARADFFAGLGAGIDGSWAGRVGTLVDSNSEVESYNWLGASPQMQAHSGEALGKELPKYSHTITNVDYEATLRIQKGDIRRDKTGQIRTRMNGVGVKAGRHWESLVSTLIAAGDAAGGECYDGDFFFDTDHSSGVDGQSDQTNDLGATEVPSSNVASTTLPTPDEAARIIIETLGHMFTLKDDQGDPINSDAMNWVIMTGSAAHWGAYQTAIAASNLTSGASNPLQGLKDRGISLECVLNPRLAVSTKTYFLNEDGEVQPFILQDEVPVDVWEEDPGNRFKYIYAGVNATRAAGYGLWQRAAMVTLT